VLLVEDLHWADPSTLEWLGLLIEQCATAGVLVLLTHRPAFEPPWAAREHVLPVALGRLHRRQARELAAGVVAGATLPEELVNRIAARSDGVPLFAEELAKGVVEAGGAAGGSLSSLEIPETLQDSLMARLDRLGEAKAVAQLGAALGREFPYALLEAIATMRKGALREGLGRLVQAELAYQRGLPPQATYTFKHALVQDTAYASLLESQRKELHGRIADALEARFAERVARAPEEIARHCEQAGRTEQAIAHYQRAGERATQRSAHVESVAHFERAIALLRTLPESRERNRQEIRLRLALGAPLQATRGMYDAEVEEAYGRALELSGGLADGSERFRALAGLATGEELLAHAERTGEPSELLFAHSTLGVALHYGGELSKALAHDERAIALYDPAQQALLESVYGLDPGIVSLCLAAFARLQLGYPDRALQRVEQAIERARGHSHAYSLAYSLNWAAIVGYLRGEAQRVLERADEAIEISTQRGLAQQLGGALIFRAWALAVIADAETAGRALDPLTTNLAAGLLGSRGGPVGAPFVTAICDAQRRLDRLDAALDTADAALAHWAEIEAPYWDSEFLRLKGEIRLAQDPAAHGEAESLFLRAIEIARRQEGRALELRAATSLARVWRRRGRKQEARALLAPVSDWFGEGFDTADLKDARALLDELA
jgi:tetratricopeptide (TPR) repeat protein